MHSYLGRALFGAGEGAVYGVYGLVGERDMKRLIGLLVVLVLGFYVAWPAWSAYRIATALTNRDETALGDKVDFPSVRASLKPLAMAEIGRRIDKETGVLGPMGQAIAANLKAQMSGQFVDQILEAAVTPRSVIRVANDGGDIASSIEKAVSEASGKFGGAGGSVSGGTVPSAGGLGGLLGQAAGATPSGAIGAVAGHVMGRETKAEVKPVEPAQAAQTAPSPSGAKRSFGLGNIKGFSMAGPFGFNIAVARDVSQSKAEAVVGMSFTGTDWKLARVVPNL